MEKELSITTILNKKLQMVASNIRDARLKRNYSQDYLAFKLGISQNAYSKLEIGRTRVTVERLFLIADILEVNVSELVSFTKVVVGDKLQYVSALN